MKATCLSVAAAVVMALAPIAPAQPGRYDPTGVSAVVDRIHRDLNDGYRTWHVSGGDRGRLNNAEKQLRDFAKKWYRGRFDKGELDEAIGAIQHVIDRNRLTGRERDALWGDVTELRNMREAYNRHELGGRR